VTYSTLRSSARKRSILKPMYNSAYARKGLSFDLVLSNGLGNGIISCLGRIGVARLAVLPTILGSRLFSLAMLS
jgi:hypothetical protein